MNNMLSFRHAKFLLLSSLLLSILALQILLPVAVSATSNISTSFHDIYSTKYPNYIQRDIQINDISISILVENVSHIFSIFNSSVSWKHINGSHVTADWFMTCPTTTTPQNHILSLKSEDLGIKQSKLHSVTEIYNHNITGMFLFSNYTGNFYHETIISGFNITYFDATLHQ